MDEFNFSVAEFSTTPMRRRCRLIAFTSRKYSLAISSLASFFYFIIGFSRLIFPFEDILDFIKKGFSCERFDNVIFNVIDGFIFCAIRSKRQRCQQGHRNVLEFWIIFEFFKCFPSIFNIRISIKIRSRCFFFAC